ncbi:TPA: sugar ABC transporter permease [Candidatus Bathyarchaeota archaeon]|nr:sugar ABC transporter permease [Candidatus Bathyarchaeota archaeon]
MIPQIRDWIGARREELLVASFMFPMLVMLVTFQLIPTLWAIWFSFTDMALVGKSFLHPSFLGLRNFEKIANDSVFRTSLSVTFEYCSVSLIWRFALGLIMSLYLTSKLFQGKKIMAAIFLLPWIIPGVLRPYVWMSILDTRHGIANRLLQALDLPQQSWVYKRAMESVIAINTWSGYAFAMLVLASALKSIPEEYYEIAEVYGASRWYKLSRITLPLIKFPLILSIILIFKEDIDDFAYVYMLTDGGPHYRTELLSLYAYHQAFAYYELGYGCAVGVIIAAIVFILSLAQLRFIRL